ncbi:MAG TPA: hypothetical protein VHD83_15975 [Puia sp.]|nr:hypothetical protein [Puia sp.]
MPAIKPLAILVMTLSFACAANAQVDSSKYYRRIISNIYRENYDSLRKNPALIDYKLDYSLQLSAGIRNFYQSKIDSAKSHSGSRAKALTLEKAGASGGLQDLPEVTRDGLMQPNK